MTDKEKAELVRLDRKVKSGKASRAEILRAFDLQAKKRQAREVAQMRAQR